MDERVFACMYCGASFLHQSKLTRHILSHSLESLKYREQASLQLQAHLGIEPGMHLPPEAHFTSGGSVEPMDLELAAHSDPTSGVVLCKFCGKSFPDVGSLIAHLPAHTGDRPFKCEFCGKAFKLRHHMKDHCRVHTGERPFRCTLCGKTFSRSTILKAHEKNALSKVRAQVPVPKSCGSYRGRGTTTATAATSLSFSSSSSTATNFFNFTTRIRSLSPCHIQHCHHHHHHH